MATSIPTQDLIREVYHPNSTQGKNLSALVHQYELSNNTMGIALVNQLLALVKDKLPQGSRFSGVIVPKLILHEKVRPGKRLGKASVSSQALREGYGYDLTLYDRFDEVQARSGQLAGIGGTKGVPDILVGKEHRATLEAILAANFDPKELELWATERRKNTASAGSLSSAFDAVYARVGVPNMGSYRRMLLLGPTHMDESVVSALADPHAFRNDMNWLEGNVDTMPTSVRMAYSRFISPVIPASKEDAALMVAGIYQFKPEKAKGLIGQFRDDALYLEKLTGEHPVFDTVERPDLEADFEPLRLVQDADIPASDMTRREKLEQQFVTRAEALSLMRSIPVYQAREAHNTALAQHYFGTNFPQILEQATAVMKAEAERFRLAKQRKEQFEGSMVRSEYFDVKYVANLLEYAKNNMTETEREALVRLVPMHRAKKVFANVYLVAAKARLGLDQRKLYVPAQDCGEDLATKIQKVRGTVIGPNTDDGVKDERFLCCRAGAYKGKTGLNVPQYSRMAALLDNDELVPAGLAGNDDAGHSLIDVLHGVAEKAEPVDDQTRKELDYLSALMQSSLGVQFSHIDVNGSEKNNHARHQFKPQRYAGAKFLLEDQKKAVHRVYATVQKIGLADLDLTQLDQAVPQLEGKEIFLGWSYQPHAVPTPYKAGRTHYKGISYAHHLRDASSAVSTEQDPKLFAALARVQHIYQEELKKLAAGKALASAGLLEQARKTLQDYTTGKIQPDMSCTLDEKSFETYHKYGIFDVHAQSKGADPQGEIIKTFSSKHDGVQPTKCEWTQRMMFSKTQGNRWVARLDKNQLNDLCTKLALDNAQKERDVYLTIDGGDPKSRVQQLYRRRY